jgi:hypothetical protein
VYDARFLISEHTFRGLVEPERFAIRRVDRVAVKGKNDAVDVYEVVDAEAPERRAAKIATRPMLDAAMESYFARKFEVALASFKQVSAQDPEDAVPVLLAVRCSRYLQAPPPENWRGFEKLINK